MAVGCDEEIKISNATADEWNYSKAEPAGFAI